MKKVLSFILAAMLLTSCGLVPSKQVVTINVSVSSPVGANPDGYEESLISSPFTTKWVEKNVDKPKEPWGWITTDTVKIQSVISVVTMNQRIADRFKGLDPFQLDIQDGPDVAKISDFAATGLASMDAKFAGTQWNMTLVSAIDPYPQNGLELVGFTDMGVVMKETLPGSNAQILFPYGDFQALVLGTKIKVEKPVVIETDMTSCLDFEYQHGSGWIATIEDRPAESSLAMVQAETLLNALLSSISGPITVYHAVIPETHQECRALVAVKSSPPTPTPRPSSTPIPTATLPALNPVP